MISCRSWNRRTPGGPLELLEGGDIITFNGIPGLSMLPLDAEAVAAMRKSRPNGPNAHDRRIMRHGRLRLTRQQRVELEAAEAEMRASGISVEI
jgi:hypothetical protein